MLCDSKVVMPVPGVAGSEEMGLSRKVIAREYDRLISLLPSAIRETAVQMEAEGFLNAQEIAQKVLDLV